MQKRLNRSPCTSLWGFQAVLYNTLYSTMSTMVGSCFLLKEYSSEEHHHSTKVPTDRKYFLTESLCFLFTIFILLLSHIFRPLLSLLLLTFSIDLNTFAWSQPFSQSSPSKHSPGGCWHDCDGHSWKWGHLPPQCSSSPGTDPLSASSVPLAFKGHLLSFLWSKTGTVVCSVRLPKINQIGSWPVSLVGWLPWHARLPLPQGVPTLLLWVGGAHLPWILLQWLDQAICGYPPWCKHKWKARAFNSYPGEIFAFTYGQDRKRQGVGEGITNQIKRSAQFLMLNISGVGDRQISVPVSSSPDSSHLCPCYSVLHALSVFW